MQVSDYYQRRHLKSHARLKVKNKVYYWNCSVLMYVARIFRGWMCLRVDPGFLVRGGGDVGIEGPE